MIVFSSRRTSSQATAPDPSPMPLEPNSAIYPPLPSHPYTIMPSRPPLSHSLMISALPSPLTSPVSARQRHQALPPCRPSQSLLYTHLYHQTRRRSCPVDRRY